jgi:hypothetical protein
MGVFCIADRMAVCPLTETLQASPSIKGNFAVDTTGQRVDRRFVEICTERVAYHYLLVMV